MKQTVHKVTCFILRKAEHGADLLLFRHPYAGIQIPAGTVNPNEDPQAAAIREAREESGLNRLNLVRWLGDEPEPPRKEHMVIVTPTAVYARPDPYSFAWAQFRIGLLVKVLRSADGFTQVSYQESNDVENPQYVTYNITGWVPDENLTDQITRHFYLFEHNLESPERWLVDTDYHKFKLFWAPLVDLPPIIPPQDLWLKKLEEFI